ncbi:MULTISPECIES: DUF2786 domain-containing protein [Bifidobacterium]|uniref:Uncharacterized protein n=2 Tax=Bifidobacterium TaxID=1678 RepID=A0A261FTI8_9BIFI|nr:MULTISPECIES: DUF2786 domain-containing protein [Bifidobacterium]OZG62492.1 hypothetical protein BLEM_1038 [Bifidobacterium lemurum]OZG69028.1 hypothetical protein BEUL_0434 [Bifidobacterium eulemuris]QOL31444.1 DUF2786 domain-containing protein [Bifidobacterium eulemuris]QOL33833.1 DUF2786 domain-containing protein [Bifidobacterium lemurum]
MSDDRFERMLERVRRLLALAEDPASSDSEAEVAYERAQKLMQEHAIESWRLRHVGEPVERISEKCVPVDASPVNRYKAALAKIIAEANQCDAFCSAYTSRNHRDVITSVTFVGTPGNIEKSVLLWQSMELRRAAHWRIALSRERARIAANIEKELSPSHLALMERMGASPARYARERCAEAPFRNGFYLGFCQRIEARFAALGRDMESVGSDLMLSHRNAISDYMAGHDLKTMQCPALTVSHDGVRAGREDADMTSIGLAETEAERSRYEIHA